MIKKLTIICMLIVMLFTLTSCFPKKKVYLPLRDWAKCSEDCRNTRCVSGIINIENLDPNDSTKYGGTIIDTECNWDCMRKCTVRGNDISENWIEFNESNKKFEKRQLEKDTTGDLSEEEI